jgi:hypothetical protein
VVAMRATVSGSQAISLTAGNSTILSYGSVSNDTHAGWNTGTNVYTIPVSGFYRLSAMLYLNAVSQGTGNYNELTVGFGSGGGFRIARTLQYLVNGDISLNGSTIRYLNAGDTVAFYYASGSNMTGTKVNDQGLNYIAIERLSGPSVVAASESVNASYIVATGAGQSVPNTGSTIINFGNKIFDSHNAVTTGASWKFTAPVSGKYQINAGCYFVPSVYAIGNIQYLELYKNGSFLISGPAQTAQTTSSVLLAEGLSVQVSLNAGEYIDIRANNNRTAGATTTGDGSGVSVQISRVGN